MGRDTQFAEQLFAEALDLEPPARRVFLNEACRDAPELRKLVDQLLLEDERAGSFLKRPILDSNGEAGSSYVTLSSLNGDHRTPSAAPRFQVGDTIGQRFVVVRFIARGGMGEVYEVEDPLLHGDRVALKTILPEIATDSEASHRFEQEVLLARKINHPNLCPIYEIFRCEEAPPPFLFLTMKLLTGETLDARLKKDLLLPREEALEIFRQMIAGILAIHAAGVVHRDIKPTNVMLDRSGSRFCVSIMDFGLARLYASDVTLLRPGTMVGTPGYLAPEMLRGHPPSRASDIFALGVLLHQVFTGDRPVESADGISLYAAPSLNLVRIPAAYTTAVREFLSADPIVRCRAFERVQSTLDQSSTSRSGLLQPPRTWTRRQMLIATGAASCAIAGGAIWNRDQISEWMHPLPLKRFVALVGWPPSGDETIKPMLSSLIDSISSELSRAEAFDHNLFLIPHFASADVTTPAQLDEVRESLGANLVLAASGRRSPKDMHVALHVLAPSTSRVLRSKEIHARLDEELSLPQKVVRAAAELLNITHYEPDDKRIQAGTDNPEAYAAFQAAEALRLQDNDTGLEQAIDKYKQAVLLDSHFALSYAMLAVVYCRMAYMKHNPAAVALARANAETAIAIDSNLVAAHMARAAALSYSGDVEGANREMKRALALDPSNALTMIWQAQLFARVNRWHDAEEAFHRALQLRPNDWLAHNELGVVLNSQGKYRQAISEFRATNLANPKNALALNNIANVHLQLGQVGEAETKLEQSLAIRPSSIASASMSAALRSQGKLASALEFAKRSTDLDSGDGTAWLELGDCNSMIRGHDKDANAAYLKAAEVQREELEVDPSDGQGWILLSLFEAKTGQNAKAMSHLQKADALPSSDLDSQMYKARALEVLGRREDALKVLTACFRRGATPFSVTIAPDMENIRKDLHYQELIQRLQAKMVGLENFKGGFDNAC